MNNVPTLAIIFTAAVLTLLPPLFIFRSQAVRGAQKAKWVLGCLLSGLICHTSFQITLGFVVGLLGLDPAILKSANVSQMILVSAAVSTLMPLVIYMRFKQQFTSSNN